MKHILLILAVLMTGCSTVDMTEWKIVPRQDCSNVEACEFERYKHYKSCETFGVTCGGSWENCNCETHYEFIKK